VPDPRIVILIPDFFIFLKNLKVAYQQINSKKEDRKGEAAMRSKAVPKNKFFPFNLTLIFLFIY